MRKLVTVDSNNNLPGNISNTLLSQTQTSLTDGGFIPVNVKDLGAVGDGVSDDTSAFIEAFRVSLGDDPYNFEKPTGTFKRLLIPRGTYKVDPNTLSWDIYRVVVEADFATIIVNNTQDTDIAVSIVSSAPRKNGTAISNSSRDHSGFSLVSGGSRKGVGLFISGTVNSDNTSETFMMSQAVIRNMSVSGFKVGHRYGSNSYMFGFSDGTINDCDTYVDVPTGIGNSGERLFYTNYLFGNQVSSSYGVPSNVYTDQNVYGIQMSIDQSIVFNNCSFDWTAKLINTAPNSQVYFSQCHFETPYSLMIKRDSVQAGNAYGSIGAYSIVDFTQCRWLFAGDSLPASTLPIPHLFKVDGWGCLSLNGGNIYSVSPFIPAWSSGYTISTGIRTFQSSPSKTLPLPSYGSKFSLIPGGWDFSSVDSSWVFTGDEGSGSTVTDSTINSGRKSLSLVGKTASAKFPSKVKESPDCAGLSAVVQSSTDLGVELRISLKDVQGNLVTDVSHTINLSADKATPIHIAKQLHVSAAKSLSLVDLVEFSFKVVNSPKEGTPSLYITNISSGVWK